MTTSGAHLTLDHLVAVVSDVQVSSRFYAEVLGATIIDLESYENGQADHPIAHFGTWKINLHPAAATLAPVAREHRPGSVDIALRWPGSVDDAQRHLADHDVPLVAGPTAQYGAQGWACSVFFSDPDGSLLEFICYPLARSPPGSSAPCEC